MALKCLGIPVATTMDCPNAIAHIELYPNGPAPGSGCAFAPPAAGVSGGDDYDDGDDGDGHDGDDDGNNGPGGNDDGSGGPDGGEGGDNPRAATPAPAPRAEVVSKFRDRYEQEYNRFVGPPAAIFLDLARNMADMGWHLQRGLPEITAGFFNGGRTEMDHAVSTGGHQADEQIIEYLKKYFVEPKD